MWRSKPKVAVRKGLCEDKESIHIFLSQRIDDNKVQEAIIIHIGPNTMKTKDSSSNQNIQPQISNSILIYTSQTAVIPSPDTELEGQVPSVRQNPVALVQTLYLY